MNPLKLFIFTLPIFISIQSLAFPQNLMTQTIRGKVVDNVAQYPLHGANILLLGTSLGSASDVKGNFRIERVPIGRYDIKVSYIGYAPTIIPEVFVGSGKAIIVNIELNEVVIVGDVVVVRPDVIKDKPMNDMAFVSARTFSVDEARRYAGGMDDPARLASSFAGVTTALSQDNGIVVRGNAPKAVLWMLEGVELPNPNHFAGLTNFGGGGISALSSMMLSNSDFHTGAFPAEFGNGLSGVFDLRLKTGNDEEHEHTAQVGLMGIDFASEGPLSRSNNSSYSFNYRYSTLGLVRIFLPDETSIPAYQDLAFKIKYPTKKLGAFSLWGIGLIDNIGSPVKEDTSEWTSLDDGREFEADLNMAALGLNNRVIIGKNSFMNSTLAFTSSGIAIDFLRRDFDQNKSLIQTLDNNLRRVILTSNLYHKFSRKHSNKTGISVHQLLYNIDIQDDVDEVAPLEQIVDESGSSQLIQSYSQSIFKIGENFALNMGLNFQLFTLSNKSSFEPRAGVQWILSDNQSLSLGYGLHSRLEPLNIYMAQQQTAEGFITPNKELELTKAHHFVLGYDVGLGNHTRLKVEPYYQRLFDVPVIPDSSYSLLNMEGDWYFNQTLVNEGTGINLGIDLTLERFLNNDFYYLITASIFSSKYKGGDGIERDTRFNRNFVLNGLAGKEWRLGSQKNKTLGLNLRLQLLGGKRWSPVDYEASIVAESVIYDEGRAFDDQAPTSYYGHITVTYRKNFANRSSVWALQLFNIPSSLERYGHFYNFRTGQIEERELFTGFPTLSYKVEF